MIYNFNGIEYKTVKKFFSRIHSVYLLETCDGNNSKYILKDFENNLDRITAELAGINTFKKLSPKVIFSDNRYILHEYFPRETFLYHFEEAEKNESNSELLTISLLNFLESIYDYAPGFILGDINFANFIVSDNNCIRFIDFENVCQGMIEDDLGRIAAFALTYNPAFTDWKYDFTIHFIKSSMQILNVSEEKIFSYMKEEFEAMKTRRNMEIDIPDILKRIKKDSY